MRYHYYVQAFSGKPLKCPHGLTHVYFQAIQEMTGYDLATARRILLSGMGINVRSEGKRSRWHCRFYALPAGVLEPIPTSDTVTLTELGTLQ